MANLALLFEADLSNDFNDLFSYGIETEYPFSRSEVANFIPTSRALSPIGAI